MYISNSRHQSAVMDMKPRNSFMFPGEIELLKDDCKIIEAMFWENHSARHTHKPVIDGIINIEKYSAAGYKILWLLKQPSEDEIGTTKGGGWQLAADLLLPPDFYQRIGVTRLMWHPVIYVSYGILNGFKRWNQMGFLRRNPFMADIVQHIAIINVEKVPGMLGLIDHKTIRAAYHKNQELLHKQIATYNPDIIIGGSTLKLFCKDLGINKNDLQQSGSVAYAEKNAKLYIDALHPGQTSIKRDDYVNDIINLAKEWSLR